MNRFNAIGFQITNSAKSSKISIKDDFSEEETKIELDHDAIPAKKLPFLNLTNGEKIPLRIYDPGYVRTASAKSAITFIDGEKGILSYRGYKIEELCSKSSFLEVAFLLIYGDLPSKNQLSYFTQRVMRHTFIHSDLATMMKSFRYNSHPMGMLISSLAAMSTLHPEANPALAGQAVYDDRQMRNKQIHRLLGTVPTIAAFSYRHRQGRPFAYPSHRSLGYAENFLYMLDRVSNLDYTPHPALARALDVLFILHADHELNCSTAAMRHLASSGVDVYSAVAGATSALYGPRHGGANQAVIAMLKAIGDVAKIPAFLEDVKRKKTRLMGFGHRVYKNYDPRARIVKSVAERVFEIVGKEPLIEIAMELEKTALADEYFVKRKLYPNIDFYSGIIYKAMGFPEDFFPVLFAIPRTVGWLAHWNEFLDDPDNKITRPRQIYTGQKNRKYVEIEKRENLAKNEKNDKNLAKNVKNDLIDLKSSISAESKRRFCSDVLP